MDGFANKAGPVSLVRRRRLLGACGRRRPGFGRMAIVIRTMVMTIHCGLEGYVGSFTSKLGPVSRMFMRRVGEDGNVSQIPGGGREQVLYGNWSDLPDIDLLQICSESWQQRHL